MGWELEESPPLRASSVSLHCSPLSLPIPSSPLASTILLRPDDAHRTCLCSVVRKTEIPFLF